MSNEMYNVLARVTNGLYEGIAIGGDVYPGSTLSDHVLRFNNIPQVTFSQIIKIYFLWFCLSLIQGAFCRFHLAVICNDVFFCLCRSK